VETGAQLLFSSMLRSVRVRKVTGVSTFIVTLQR
jgi:hypothetical protein